MENTTTVENIQSNIDHIVDITEANEQSDSIHVDESILPITESQDSHPNTEDQPQPEPQLEPESQSSDDATTITEPSDVSEVEEVEVIEEVEEVFSSGISNEVEQEQFKSLEEAKASKEEGNSYFRSQNFDEALNSYTRAIESCPLIDTEDLVSMVYIVYMVYMVYIVYI